MPTTPWDPAPSAPALPAPYQPRGPTEETARTVETVLADWIRQMPVEPPARGRGRPRVLPSLCLWAGLLVCVTRGFASQLALWRLLSGGGFWFFPPLPISDQAVYRGLAQAGTAPLERLFGQISALVAARLDPLVPAAFRELAGFAREVVAIDAMTLDQVARTLTGLRALPAGAAALSGGKLAGVFDVRRQQWRTVQLLPDARENDKVAAPALVAGLAPGTLVLADLGYLGFAWFDALTAAGLWSVSRLRAKTSYTLVHVYYHQGQTLDALVWLGADRADRARSAVRLVQFVGGGTTRRSLTNVRDPLVFPLREIACVYARR